MPDAVYSISEDALEVLARYESMAQIYSRLLIKLANYVADSEDIHMHCRWGEGGNGYTTHVATGNTRAANSSMALVEAVLGSMDMIPALVSFYNDQSFKRAQNCASILHKAVSAGGLTNEFRAGIAFIAAQICHNGIKVNDMKFLLLRQLNHLGCLKFWFNQIYIAFSQFVSIVL